MSDYLAFDLGAESGRAVIGTINDNRINISEIHRFSNIQIEDSGHIYWDIPYLFGELRKSLSIAVDIGYNELNGIGIDTWGVDYGIIGKDQRIMEAPYAYRDSRTNGMMEEVFKVIPEKDLYSLTGIQFMQFNTIFQIYGQINQNRDFFNNAESLLFMPDLLNYLMSGEVVSEYTIASTSQLLNIHNKIWEKEIFTKLELPLTIMPSIVQPGTVIGKLLPDIARETGLSTVDIIAPACHDTACAVAAVPAGRGNRAYISSGTWSLVGIETDEPIVNELSLENNFTNEGGVNGKIRFLKNMMGLWLLQGCMKIWSKDEKDINYGDLVKLAAESEPFKCIIDPDHNGFLNHPDMIEEITKFCRNTGQPIPETKGEVARCIFESLAFKYRIIIEQINLMIDESVDTIHIVGGGSQNLLLDQFTSNASGLPVSAGPVEATALGNIIVQAAAKNDIADIEEGRRIIAGSFPLEHFEPEDTDLWKDNYEKVKGLFSDR
ncbi:MAG: rhamnulokinase [bacterium]|nr:rhamnulokinase [bacterium]